jgi:hypothetical protein
LTMETLLRGKCKPGNHVNLKVLLFFRKKSKFDAQNVTNLREWRKWLIRSGCSSRAHCHRPIRQLRTNKRRSNGQIPSQPHPTAALVSHPLPAST